MCSCQFYFSSKGHDDSPPESASQPTPPRVRLALPVLREVDQRPLNSTMHEPTMTIRLWQTYLEFVDPLLRIYYSAIVVVPAKSCHSIFGTHKTFLLERYVGPISACNMTDLARYRHQVEKAFAEANILRCQDLTLLQAFVLYLVSRIHLMHQGQT